MGGVMRWEQPPRPKRQRIDWQEIARQLRSRPGEWAAIYEGPTDSTALTMRRHLRTGRNPALTPASEFEMTCRGTVLYGRWIGDEQQEQAEGFDPYLPDLRCGTQAGAKAHARDGEPLCEPCRRAQSRARMDSRAGQRRVSA